MIPMWFPKRQTPFASPFLLDLGGGHVWTLDDARTHLFVCGSSGSGKSFSTEGILKELHRLGCPMLSTGIKPDEPQRYERICDPHRFVRIRPGGPYRLNLFMALYKLYGNIEGVMQFCTKLNECVMKSGSNANQETYWQTQHEGSLLHACRLNHLAFGELNIENVYQTIASAPKSRDEFKLPQLLERGDSPFALVLREAIKNRTDANENDLQRSLDFFNNLSGIGDKGHAAVLAMAAGTLGRLSEGPFRDHFCTDTTITFEEIEKNRLCVLLDFPVLKHGIAGRLLNLAWTLYFQAWCLQRPYDPTTPPSVLVRDEAQYILNSEFDYQVATVARSQGLVLISIVQDLDVLQACLGGDSKAEHESFAFVSNHASKLVFANSNTRTGQHVSDMIGEHREMFTTVSSAPGEPERWSDKLLGVGRFSLSASEQMRPHVTAADIASLPRGLAVFHQAGRKFDGKPYLVADLRRKP
jgi:type IV secretory pathway TraG/TraD family ATPase VirD4